MATVKIMYVGQETKVEFKDDLPMGEFMNIANTHLPMLLSMLRRKVLRDQKMDIMLDYSDIPLKNMNDYKLSLVTAALVKAPFEAKDIMDLPRSEYVKLTTFAMKQYPLTSFLD